jgi:hypothetical protein
MFVQRLTKKEVDGPKGRNWSKIGISKSKREKRERERVASTGRQLYLSRHKVRWRPVHSAFLYCNSDQAIETKLQMSRTNEDYFIYEKMV